MIIKRKHGEIIAYVTPIGAYHNPHKPALVDKHKHFYYINGKLHNIVGGSFKSGCIKLYYINWKRL